MWRHYSIFANCINKIQNSALNAHLSLHVEYYTCDYSKSRRGSLWHLRDNIFLDTYPFVLFETWMSFNLLDPLLLMLRWKRLTDGKDTLMSLASLSVTGQDKPTCNISTNKVVAASIEGNFLVIHHKYTPVLLNHFLPCCYTHYQQLLEKEKYWCLALAFLNLVNMYSLLLFPYA